MKVLPLFLTVLVPLSIVPLAASCGAEDDGGHDDALPSCEEDDRDEEYFSGINKVGPAGYTVAITDSDPSPPTRGDNVWTIDLKDETGAPATGLSLTSSPFMPDHGHGTPVVAVVTEVGDGGYEINPVNLFMPGLWEVTLKVVDPGATESPDDDSDVDTVLFKFCVEG